jgi:hypothetical protein
MTDTVFILFNTGQMLDEHFQSVLEVVEDITILESARDLKISPIIFPNNYYRE